MTRRNFLGTAAALCTIPAFGQEAKPPSRDDVYDIDPLDIRKLRAMLRKDPKADVLESAVSVFRGLSKSDGPDILAHMHVSSQLRGNVHTAKAEIDKLRLQANVLLSANPATALTELNKQRPASEKLSNSDADIEKGLSSIAHRIATLENAIEMTNGIAVLHEKSFPRLKR